MNSRLSDIPYHQSRQNSECFQLLVDFVDSLSIKYICLSQSQQMSTKEIEAIESLANLPDQDDHFSFEPYNSTIYHQPKEIHTKQRPKTVSTRKNKAKSTNCSFRQINKREQLKKQLRILEQHQQVHCQKGHQRIITSQSVYFMQPIANRYNGFPAKPVKKQQPDQFVNYKALVAKENFTPYYCLNPQEAIRNDIMKKFKLRESVRESEKITKINNFLKMTGTPSSRNKPAPILYLNDSKFKRTLTNLLS